MIFGLDSGTMTIIHLEDENPWSEENKKNISQYIHGGVHLSGETFSVGFVFRVVKKRVSIICQMIQWYMIILVDMVMLLMASLVLI